MVLNIGLGYSLKVKKKPKLDAIKDEDGGGKSLWFNARYRYRVRF